MTAQKTALFQSHQKSGARFINFAGFCLPFCYRTGAAKEHLSARRHAALFDVSHMGRLRIQGKEALDFLARLLPAHAAALPAGEAQYSALLNEKGGIIDDLVVYCMQKGGDYLLCVNASAKEKDMAWIQKQGARFAVQVKDETAQWSLLALQGPDSLQIAEAVFQKPFSALKKFEFLEDGGRMFVRAGYTGEKGLEIYSPVSKAVETWEMLLSAGNVTPAGLGARDTLRLEMGYLLSGQDFDEARSLDAAGLSWLKKNPENYIGMHSAISEHEKLAGFVLKQPLGVPRSGCFVYDARGGRLGHVTSGAKSPSLEKMIGLAYIKKTCENFFVEIHGLKAPAEVRPPPFLKKNKIL